MAVCNLFKKFSKNTGNILMFSQYTEDLIKGLTDPNYKVTPSKFVAMDITYKKSNCFSNEYDLNVVVPTYFQNYFENTCSFLRQEMGQNWTPVMSSNILWRCLCKSSSMLETDDSIYGVIDVEDDGVANSINWVGDINIQSYGIHDGMGYTELFCHIPTTAKKMKFKLSLDEISDDSILNPNTHIEGWPERQGDMLDNTISPTYCSASKKWDPVFLTEGGEPQESNSFNINTVLILYDIINSKKEKVYENIPMGLYFTGLINEDGSVDNAIIKYSSHEDIYDSGTSYGLRICSRFSLTPQNLSPETSITLNDEDYSSMSEAMSRMSETQAKMDELIYRLYDHSQDYKDLYAIFKNNRTNVPYVKVWNGKSYWFVNGRNTGVEVYQNTMIDNTCSTTTDSEVQNEIDRLDQVYTEILDVRVSPNTEYYEFGTQAVVNFGWEILLENENIVPEYLWLNDLPLDVNTNTYTATVMNDTNFTIKAKNGNLEAEDTFSARFVYPSYIGLIDQSAFDEGNISNLGEVIQSLTHSIPGSKEYVYTYSNSDSKHVCYAYPASYGELTSIKDNTFEYLDDFNMDRISIILNGVQVLYNVYIDKDPADVVDYTLKFS